MSEPGSRRGRIHKAEKAREAILDAAELVFTEHGFDGARIDAIAIEAGYNKSLIFQYFGDKLGLYAEVTKRADKEMSELQGRVLVTLFEDDTVATDARKFRALLENIVGALFDYLLEHPRLVRIILWEQAENWQTYKKIFSQLDTEDHAQFERLFQRAWKSGLLRSNFAPLLQITMALQMCMSYLSYIPIYEMVLPGEDVSSAAALASAREYIMNSFVAGTMSASGYQKTEI